eukprot:TRINITY_DN3536_c0_g2_i1.p3 TRINITY_DN3536_c0_g2~~TRINITY_DN3536_c0_g2_i1.p3  ORF type:complete len:101 (-),score=4.10 TRINITY_DN3536_c0_g2_i1:62-364(-)
MCEQLCQQFYVSGGKGLFKKLPIQTLTDTRISESKDSEHISEINKTRPGDSEKSVKVIAKRTLLINDKRSGKRIQFGIGDSYLIWLLKTQIEFILSLIHI